MDHELRLVPRLHDNFIAALLPDLAADLKLIPWFSSVLSVPCEQATAIPPEIRLPKTLIPRESQASP
jgi:hypothetical protein